MAQWLRPKTVSEVRSVLRLVGYYIKFVKKFSRIATSLTKLTRKEVPSECDKGCEISFAELKKRLTSAPVLVIPSGVEGFTVYTDASKYGIEAVLMQHGRVVAYSFKAIERTREKLPSA